MKKILVSTLLLTLLSGVTTQAGELMAREKIEYDPNQSTSLTYYDNDTNEQVTTLIPNYFVEVYKDTNNPLEKYIPMIFKNVEMPLCIERIYNWYEVESGEQVDLNIYDIYEIGDKFFISKR